MDWDAYTKDRGATGFPQDLLHRYAGGSVLDAGCGGGHHLVTLAAGSVKVGVEISLGALEEARARSGEIFFVQASADRLPFAAASFDTVLSIDVIEHLQRPAELLEEISRVLRPHGRLILQTPNYPSKRFYDVVNFLKPGGWRESLKDDPTHVVKFSWRRIERLVGRKFAIVESRTRNILLESKLPFLRCLKSSWLGKLVGQKTIVVAEKAIHPPKE